ncbi:MAG TPA: FAD-dependent oxidoreductase [bacterium]|nr:FAD-dependent oxidoreductase [bacterium]
MNSHRKIRHVVVLGAGYGGLMTALRLARKTDASIAITLVNASDTFGDRVRNHQVAAGQPVRPRLLASFLRGTRIRFVQGTVTTLNLPERQVMVQTPAGPQAVGYDYLVYALGSFVRTEGLPGAREHAHTVDRASALALAARLPEVARRGGRLLVVGGGNTGVEVATELAESHPGLRLTLATRRSFAPQLSLAGRAYILKAFDRFGIRFLEHTAIASLGEHEARTERGEAIPFDLCVVVAGFVVSDLARHAGLRVNDRGQILIDRAMRSLSHPDIYAVGDAGAPAAEPGAPVRMAAYTALAMGAHGADCLAAELTGTAPTAFGLSYQAFGLSLGRRDGVVQFLNGDHDRPLDRMFTGKAAGATREFFVRLIEGILRAQRLGPWTFPWPGKNKMRGVTVAAPRHAAAVPDRVESLVGAER